MQSTHWGADDSVDELLYDSKSVDDWGVNRDMSGAYRQVSFFSLRACQIASLTASTATTRSVRGAVLQCRCCEDGFWAL